MRTAILATAALAAASLLVPTTATAQEGGEKHKKKQGYSQPDVSSLVQAAQSLGNQGKWEEAAAEWRKVTDAAPNDGRGWHMLGYSLHAAGKLDDALKAHIKAASFDGTSGATAAYNVACVKALKGDSEAAIQWLGKAAEKGFSNVAHLANDSDMDALREDPRFKKLVAKMKAGGHGEGEGDAAGSVQAFVVNTPRMSSRLFYWGNAGSPGQIVVDYGAPVWKDAYAEQIDSPELVGKRWRLGQDFWTTLDTNVDLTIGSQAVAAGSYYLTLEKTAEGAFVLALLDPGKVRKAKLDSYQAAQTTGGIEVEMKHGDAEEVAQKLAIELHKGWSKTAAKLAISFGPHTLMAPVKVHLDGAKKKMKKAY